MVHSSLLVAIVKHNMVRPTANPTPWTSASGVAAQTNPWIVITIVAGHGRQSKKAAFSCTLLASINISLSGASSHRRILTTPASLRSGHAIIFPNGTNYQVCCSARWI